ncbi:hypothetical protein ACLB2K_007343 [Fragaria x ananassa]
MFPRAQAQQVQVPETLKLVRPRKGESRGHQRNSASTITENNDSTVSEATSGVGISEPFEKEACSQILTDLKNYLPVHVRLVCQTILAGFAFFLGRTAVQREKGIIRNHHLHVFKNKSYAQNPEICSISMVEFKDEDTVASLYYCSHEYHANCIKEWLRKCNLCPMCRALAIIPENYPSWDADVKLQQAYFVHLQYAVS